jgi:hypothetical protein
MKKYRFRIQTRLGFKVDNLLILARDQSHAETKLRQMYLDCAIIDYQVLGTATAKRRASGNGGVPPKTIRLHMAASG